MPVERSQVHQHRAARVRDVGRVHAPLAASREVPQDPRVHRPERQPAVLGARTGAGHVVEQPRDLGAREVGGEGQPDPLAQTVQPRLARQLAHEARGARVLPDDRVVDRPAPGACPDGAVPHSPPSAQPKPARLHTAAPTRVPVAAPTAGCIVGADGLPPPAGLHVTERSPMIAGRAARLRAAVAGNVLTALLVLSTVPTLALSGHGARAAGRAPAPTTPLAPPAA